LTGCATSSGGSLLLLRGVARGLASEACRPPRCIDQPLRANGLDLVGASQPPRPSALSIPEFLSTANAIDIRFSFGRFANTCATHAFNRRSPACRSTGAPATTTPFAPCAIRKCLSVQRITKASSPSTSPTTAAKRKGLGRRFSLAWLTGHLTDVALRLRAKD
jgi:hypothetical protein